MNKILIIFILFISVNSFAQTGDPLRDKLDSIFQPLDKTLTGASLLTK